jgi:hypothetical protein
MRYWEIAALLFGVAFVLLHWAFRAPHQYAFSHDSAFYIDMARSLAVGKWPMVAPWGLDDFDTVEIAQGVFPLGYSVILAILGIAGFDIVDVAPWVNRTAAALIPLLIVLLFRSVASGPVLFGVGVLVLTGTGVQGNQFFALTDTICLALSVLSIGLLARSIEWRAALLAGVAAGVAYTIRNPALVLLVAIPVWYLLLIAGNTYKRGELVQSMAAWLGGVILAIAPLLIYNVITFGSVQPYSMPAAGVNAAEVAIMYIWALSGEVFGAVGAGKAAYDPVGLILLIGSFATLFLIPIAFSRKVCRARYASALLLLLFLCAGSAMIIYAGSKYQGIAGDAHRYAMQYAWALLLAGGILLPPLLSRRSWIALLGLVAVFCALRSYELLRREIREPVTYYTVAYDQPLHAFVRALHAKGEFIASDAAWIFRIEDRVPVRHLPTDRGGSCGKVESQVAKLHSIGQTRPVSAVVTKLGRFNPCRFEWARHLEGAGFSVFFDTANAAVYSKAGRQ